MIIFYSSKYHCRTKQIICCALHCISYIHWCVHIRCAIVLNGVRHSLVHRQDEATANEGDLANKRERLHVRYYVCGAKLFDSIRTQQTATKPHESNDDDDDDDAMQNKFLNVALDLCNVQ